MRALWRIGLVAALWLGGACATNPVTGRREVVLMSEQQEIALGQQADLEIEQQFGLYEDDDLQRYVERIGHELAAVSHRPDLPWRFAVLDSPAVNAFALPGGYVYLTRGIMAYLQDEAALAGVVGHEIGHVTARHAVQAYTRAGGAQLGLLIGQVFVPQMRANPYGPGLADAAGVGLGLMFLKFGRDDELQADRLGAEYAAKGGWHPRGVVEMLSTLSRIDEASDRRGTPNWLSTHPEPASRVDDVEPTVLQWLASHDEAEWRVNRITYLEQVDGLRFGDNPEDGIVRGQTFLHPVMRFAVNFPAGWDVMNSADMVRARQPGTELSMVLQLVQSGAGEDLDSLGHRVMGDAGYRITSGAETEINGLDAYIGTYSRRHGDEEEMVARAAVIRSRRLLYLLVGFGPTEPFASAESDVNASLRSFRELSQADADAIRPNALAIYTVAEGDTWQSIAQRAGGNTVPARTLALMNGYPVNEQPRSGDRVKIVTEDSAPAG